MCTPFQVAHADDDSLVRLLRAGCDAVVAEIEHRYGAALHAQAQRLLRDSRYAPEDAVQDTLLKAWTTLRADTGDTPLAPWLHTVLRNRSLDLLRSAANRNLPLQGDPLPADGDVADQVLRREALRELTEAIVQLPERQREALVRHVWAGESHSAVAAALGTTTGSAKALLHRARAQLRESTRVPSAPSGVTGTADGPGRLPAVTGSRTGRSGSG